jgi:hypothetical protein
MKRSKEPSHPMSEAFLTNVLERVSHEEVAEILKKDSIKMNSQNRDTFVSSNAEQAYILINTWLLLIEETCSDHLASFDILHLIKDRGLSAAIKIASEIADDIIHDEVVTQDAFSINQGDVDTVISKERQPVEAELFSVLSVISDMKTLLQVLRYPKRFTWVSSPDLARASVQQVFDINFEIRDREVLADEVGREPYSLWIIDNLRVTYEQYFKGFAKDFEEAHLSFSSGVCFGAKTTPQKLAVYAADTDPFWDYPGLPLYPNLAKGSRQKFCTPNAVRLTAVPKNYKTYRVIAPMHPFNAANLQRVRAAMEECLTRNGVRHVFDWTDQTRNQELARQASIDGGMATIDLSSASDRLSRGLIYELLPEDVLDVVSDYIEEIMLGEVADENGARYDQVVIGMRIFATSGNPITFISEGVFFAALTDLAYRIYGWCGGLAHELKQFSVYGDDIVVDTRVAPILIDLLTTLGCKVNQEKTFCNGGYRESCGVEYLNGVDVSSKYWPRKGMTTNSFSPNSPQFAETVAGLCSLQHRLWHNKMPRIFVEQCIRRLVPDMTSSYVGCDCFDLWSQTPQFAKRSAPHRGKISCDPIVTLREAHYVAVTEESSPKGGYYQDMNVDTYLYYQYLAYGPKLMEDPLCKSLGLTERRRVFNNPKTILKKTIR